MPDRVAELRHDSTSLYRFVDDICRSCGRQHGGSAYLASSVEFFNYIQELGTRTKEFLDQFPANIPAKTPYDSYRQKLNTLRSSWNELHRFVKTAADADTLNVPFPLIAMLQRRVRTIPGFEHTDLTVFHTNVVNYFQVRASAIRNLGHQLAAIVPNAPPFPSHLGLIGIPYSQSASVFLNTLVAHEIGHFVFQESATINTLMQPIVSALMATFGANLGTYSREQISWSIDRLRAWVEEIFCDLCAIALVGPVYSLAYIELFDLPRIIGNSLVYATFYETHPADIFRLSQHMRMFRRLGWDAFVTTLNSHYARVFDTVQNISATTYTLASSQPKGLRDQTLQAFLNIANSIHDAVDRITKDLYNPSGTFASLGPRVEEYLNQGVVPSTLVTPGGVEYPDPVTILNAAFKFKLESLQSLIATVAGEDPLAVAAHHRWTERLELWTMKALEDHSFLTAGVKQ
jgi:hypothetical protein